MKGIGKDGSTDGLILAAATVPNTAMADGEGRKGHEGEDVTAEHRRPVRLLVGLNLKGKARQKGRP